MKTAFILAADAFEQIYGEECASAVAQLGQLLGPPITPAQLEHEDPAWLGQTEVIFTGWGGPRFDAALLQRLPALRAIFYGAGSMRPILTEDCWRRNLVVANAAALNAVPTAEFAFGAILLSLKRAWANAAEIRARRNYPASLTEISQHIAGGYGSTVGLLALGQVGTRVARWLQGVEVKVVAHDPFASPAEMAALGVSPVSLETLFSQSDVVSLHAPLLPETTGLITARHLGSMKTGATLINTARGALVCEEDLIATLEARPDLQAIIDVTDPEPPAATSPLYDLANLFLTPHIAGSLGPECRRMGRAMVDEYRRFLHGEPLLHEIQKEQLARTA
jgi:phosphoglycerate dehydrogenase-like enzyme